MIAVASFFFNIDTLPGTRIVLSDLLFSVQQDQRSMTLLQTESEK